MPTQCHDNVVLSLRNQASVNSRLFRTILLASLLALAMLAFANTTILAESPPSPNVLVDDYASVPKNGSVDIEVLGNDTLPEFSSFDFTGPEFGRITSFTSNASKKILSFDYRPNTNFVGKDSFYYLVSDSNGRTLHAAVYITVYAPLDCATCLIRHAATPINVTIGGDGALNIHFIGDGGVSTGPVLPTLRELTEEHSPDSGNIVLFEGENSISGAPVVISYLSAEQVLHVNTTYRDRHDGSMKPYIFVINQDNEVVALGVVIARSSLAAIGLLPGWQPAAEGCQREATLQQDVQPRRIMLKLEGRCASPTRKIESIWCRTI